MSFDIPIIVGAIFHGDSDQDGHRYVLRNATVLPQPGDGHCLFHTLAAGLQAFGVQLAGLALRRELAFWLRRHAMEIVAGTTFQEWIAHDSDVSVDAYCTQMCCTRTWGGGIELAAFAQCQHTNVHVFERRGTEFRRISFFLVLRIQHKTSICCTPIGVITISLWMAVCTMRLV